MEWIDKVLLVKIVFFTLLSTYYSWITKRVIVKEYYKSKCATQALRKVVWREEALMIIAFTAGIPAGILAWRRILQQSNFIGSEMMLVMAAIVSLLYTIFVAALNIVSSYTIAKEVREIELSKIEFVRKNLVMKSLMLALGLFPALAIITLRAFLPELLLGGSVLGRLGVNVFPAIVMLVIGKSLFPLTMSLAINATPIKDKNIRKTISKVVDSHKIKDVDVYEFATTKEKYANAVVFESVRKKIFISTYLIENFTTEEIEAIILHEVGHIKHRHFSLKFKRYLKPILLFLFANILWAYTKSFTIEESTEAIVLSIAVLTIYVLLIVVIIREFVLKAPVISRENERQADEYVIKSGMEAKILVSALRKLATLNDTPETWSKWEGKFATHPSLNDRIKYIEDFDRCMGK